MAAFLRVIEAPSKAVALRGLIVSGAASDGRAFVVDPASFRRMTGSPFAYWATERLREIATTMSPFEAASRTSRGGMKTQEDDRFLRMTWESVPSALRLQERVPI